MMPLAIGSRRLSIHSGRSNCLLPEKSASKSVSFFANADQKASIFSITFSRCFASFASPSSGHFQCMGGSLRGRRAGDDAEVLLRDAIPLARELFPFGLVGHA